ncbi:uncharacterized protein LOC108221081 isoform X2 [Daucus carota subsp. sativus]|uniref:uncharacterized protein LOC108221081 isoform X2 n=1 Tax=Daucus carota subsp. sativus TaxID=79200 RepID=UPI0030839E99
MLNMEGMLRSGYSCIRRYNFYPVSTSRKLLSYWNWWKDVEELMSLAPEKVVLKWMNFHLKKAGYEKEVTNFSSDLKGKGNNPGIEAVYLLDWKSECSKTNSDSLG